jgi:hypothetical protein
LDYQRCVAAAMLGLSLGCSGCCHAPVASNCDEQGAIAPGGYHHSKFHPVPTRPAFLSPAGVTPGNTVLAEPRPAAPGPAGAPQIEVVPPPLPDELAPPAARARGTRDARSVRDDRLTAAPRLLDEPWRANGSWIFPPEELRRPPTPPESRTLTADATDPTKASALRR